MAKEAKKKFKLVGRAIIGGVRHAIGDLVVLTETESQKTAYKNKLQYIEDVKATRKPRKKKEEVKEEVDGE
jgi:hypothetical protein